MYSSLPKYLLILALFIHANGQRSLQSSKIVSAYGLACEDNPIVESTGVSCSTIARNVGLLGLGCDKLLSSLPGVGNLPAEAKGARVNDACPETCGQCKTCAPNCAIWFVGNGLCDEACNNAACQFDGGDCWSADCQVGPWSQWSSCSATCGKEGFVTRTRIIANAAKNGGTACPPLTEKVTGCSAKIDCPTSCVVSSWGSWSLCSSNCGLGQQLRTRLILTTPSQGGGACPSLSDSRECFIDSCSDDCLLSPWSSWSSCSRDCDGGIQSRTRSIVKLNVGAGAPCGILYEENSCKEEACSGSCEFSLWTNWSDCSVNCNGGTRQRTRSVVTVPPGLSNSDCLPTSESSTCNTQQCSTDCEIGSWSAWTACSSECGDGTRTRTRNTVPPTGNGLPCPENQQTISCGNKQCASECIVGSWSDWSDCSVSCGLGQIYRTRSITQPPTGTSGGVCPDLMESRSCQIAECNSGPSAIDCALSQWSEWSSCSLSATSSSTIECGTGEISRTRTILVQPQNKGQPCGNTLEQSPCYSGKVCDAPCELSDWGPWSNCSAECNGGSRSRSRSITSRGYGSDSCNNVDLQDIGECNSTPCTRDCVVTDWASWGECSVSCGGPGIRTRTRAIDVTPVNNGKACPALVEDDRTCNADTSCPVQCTVSEWSAWSSCSVSCGEGSINRTRTIITPGVNSECPPLSQTQACARQACVKDCELSSWAEWSTCSVTCGGGIMSRTRTIVTAPVGGSACGDTKELHVCGERSCGTLDCIVSEWATWSECPVTCGGGVQKRTRTIAQPQKAGGNACPSLEEKRGCNTFRCENLPCTDNEAVTANGISCVLLSALGCEKTLSVLAAQSGVSMPANVPPEARVRDACPATCGLCGECSPGCLLRDLDDFNCHDKCNNAACEFDKGDCDSAKYTTTTTTKNSGGNTSSSTSSDVIPIPINKQPHDCGLNLTIRDGKCVKCSDYPDVKNVSQFSCEELKSFIGCELSNPYISLPKTIPANSTIQVACPETCGLCNKFCSPNCPQAFLGNGVCDPSCNNPACNFDDNDCNNPYNPRCVDSPVITSLGYMCSVMKSFAETSQLGGCNALLGTLINPLPTWIPKTSRVKDACPLACNACQDPTIVPLIEQQVLPTTYFNNTKTTCQDLQAASYMAGGRTCAELKTMLGCNAVLSKSGISIIPPLNVNSTLSVVCPQTCEKCVDTCAPNCHTWFLGNGYCDPACYTSGCSFDYGDCEGKVVTTTTTTLPSKYLPTTFFLGNITECKNFDTLLTRALGLPCTKLQTLLSGGCDYKLIDVASNFKGTGYTPLTASRLSNLCPETCQQCTQSCNNGCPDWFLGNGQCDSACNNSRCGYDWGDCNNTGAVAEVTTTSTTGNCLDNARVSQSGYSCQLLMIIGDDKCNTTMKSIGLKLNVDFEGLFPASSTVAQLCPRSCSLCSSVDNTCGDSNSALSALGTNCALLKFQATNLLGCNTRLLDLLTTSSNYISSSTLVRDVCKQSCGLCKTPTCNDGYMNGDEEWVDCGGSCSRSCSSCAGTVLKNLGEAYLISDTANSNVWSHGSVRTVSCSENATRLGNQASVSVSCIDGTMQSPQIQCILKSDTLYGGTAIIDGKNLSLLDTSIISVIFSSLKSTLQISENESIYIKNFQIPSLSNVMDPECTDSFVLTKNGFSCQDLIQNFVCETPLTNVKSIMSEVLKNIDIVTPDETKLFHLCPKSCNHCNSAANNDYFYIPISSSNLTSLSFTGFNNPLTPAEAPFSDIDFGNSRGVTTDESAPFILSSDTAYAEQQFSHAADFSLPDSYIHQVSGSFNANQGDATTVLNANIQEPKDVTRKSINNSFIGFEYYVRSDSKSFISRLSGINLNDVMKQRILSSITTMPLKYIATGLSNGRVISVEEKDVDLSDIKVDIGSIRLTDVSAGSILGSISTDIENDQFEMSRRLMIESMLPMPISSVIDSECINNTSNNSASETNINTDSSCCKYYSEMRKFVNSSCGRLIWKGRLTHELTQSFCETTLSQFNFPNDISSNYFSDYDRETTTCYDILKSIYKTVSTTSNIMSSSDSSSFGSSISPSYNTVYSTATARSGCYILNPFNDLVSSICNKEPSTDRYCLASMKKHKVIFDDTLLGIVSRSDTELDNICMESRANSCFYSNLRVYQSLDRLKRTIQESRDYAQRLGMNGYVRKITDKLLNVICVKYDNKYCKDTVQQLINGKSHPLGLFLSSNSNTVRTLCSSTCLLGKSMLLASALQHFGVTYSSPLHLTSGILMLYGTEKSCLQNSKKNYCGDMLFSSTALVTASSTRLDDEFNNSKYTTQCQCPKWYIGDGDCDTACFSEECGYDGGDCDISKIYPNYYKSIYRVIQDVKTCLPSTSFYAKTSTLSTFSNTCKLNDDCRGNFDKVIQSYGCCTAVALELMQQLSYVNVKSLLFAAPPLSMPISSSGQASGTYERLDTWSLEFLSESCNLSFDKTCSSGVERDLLRLDTKLTGINYYLIMNNAELKKELQNRIKNEMSYGLGISSQNINRIVLHPGSIDVDVEIDTNKILFPIMSSLLNSIGLSYISTIVNKAARTTFGLLSTIKNYSDMDVISGIQPLRTIQRSGYVNYDGTYGMEYFTTNILPKEACSFGELQVLSSNYTISGALIGHEAPDGETRGASCKNGYSTDNKQLINDRVVCDNGRWSFVSGLKCYQDCPTQAFFSVADIVGTESTYYQALKRIKANDQLITDAYNISTSGYAHQDTRSYECKKEYSPSIISTHVSERRQLITCLHGSWENITLDCRKPCDAYKPQINQKVLVNQTYRNNAHGSIVRFECKEKQSIFDNAIAEFMCINGEWVEISPSGCSKGVITEMKRSFFKTAGGGVVIGIICVTLIGFLVSAYCYLKRRKFNPNSEYSDN